MNRTDSKVAKVALLCVAVFLSSGSVPPNSGSVPPKSFTPMSCGNCQLDKVWAGANTGAYRFDSSVPAHVEQAAYWADDDSWGQYYDPNDPNATTITMDWLNPQYLGQYNQNTGVLTVNWYWANQCTQACNMLIGTINHEFGHVFGFDEIYAGCEESIMSYSNDIWSITHPSAEDLCWLTTALQDDCPEGKTCEQYRKVRGRGRGGSPSESEPWRLP